MSLLGNHLVMIITAVITCRVYLFNLHALSLRQSLLILLHLLLCHSYIFFYFKNEKTKAEQREAAYRIYIGKCVLFCVHILMSSKAAILDIRKFLRMFTFLQSWVRTLTLINALNLIQSICFVLRQCNSWR